jgi:uncharacterized protein YndB with AHSA1/START domain
MNDATPDVRLVRTLPAARRDVFEAWLDPAALEQFMCPAPGSSVSRVEVDARVGGEFLIVMSVAGQELPHRGEYRAIERYERLVFSWRSGHAGERSHVVLHFDEVSPSETRLTLEHFGLDHPEAPQKHEAGWSHILSLLAAGAAPAAT